MRASALSVRKEERKDSHPNLMVPFIVILVLISDQFTKFLVTKKLLLNQSIPLIKGIFLLTLVHNRGAAFGILKNQTPLFIFTTLLAVILIYSHLKKKRLGTLTQVEGKVKEKRFSLYTLSLCLILGGALGNLADRLFLGYVVDFLDFRVWPVFNIADSAISVGAVLLGWSILRAKN